MKSAFHLILIMSNFVTFLFQLLCFFLSFCFRVNSETFVVVNKVAERKTLVHVGVVLDLNSTIGSVASECISMAISDIYASNPNYTTRLSLHLENSDDVLDAAFTAINLINKEEVNAILGPQTSMEAKFVIDVGEKAQVPIISFSATSPSLSTTQNPFFIRTGQDDSAQAKAIAAVVQAYEWREVILVYEDTEYGTGLIPYLADEFQEFDIRVTSRFAINPMSTELEILKKLNKLMALQTKVILVHMATSLGSKLFLLAKQANMISEGYAWIITDGLTSLLDPMGSKVICSMKGVLGIRPYIPQSKSLERFKREWENRNQSNDAKLNIFGYWAYDTVWALAEAVEMVSHEIRFNSIQHYDRNTSQFPDIRISKVGEIIGNQLSKIQFQGLAGDFHLVDRQLRSSAFEIINLLNNEERVIGYWTPRNGLTRELSTDDNNATYSTSKYALIPPVWPGITRKIPKGWSVPVTGSKLRIGVPVKPGFDAYMKVKRDPYTREYTVTGFSYDVFLKALELLPFAVPHKLIPYEIGERNYNQLLEEVNPQNFGAAVGDITILANRSQYVDFTLPYLQSHVSMVVKIKDDPRKNMWIFLKPLSWDLWLTTVAAFIFTGFVVWILEHRINDEFGGPPQQQVGTVVWFSFSMLVFAHREKIINNLSKFVLIIWIFVVLIVTQSYTASLASMLTVQRLQPAVVHVHELKRNGDFVGYETGSFVKDLLVKQLFFDESKLKHYGTPEEFDEALSKGSKNGGVGAIFGAKHCIELFLSKYCDKYMIAGPTYKTNGLGFAFSKGSPIVAYISRAILSVIEDKAKMDALEKKHFPTKYACKVQDEQTMISSDSLGLYSFGGLFIITGVASVMSLVIYMSKFLQPHSTSTNNYTMNHEHSVWSKITGLIKRLDLQFPYPKKNNSSLPTSKRVEAMSDAENTPNGSKASSNEGMNDSVDNATIQGSSNV